MAELADVVPTNSIDASWGNDVRDRTLQRYADDAGRTADHATPAAGDLSYLADTGGLAVYHSSAWRPFLPPGIVLPFGGPTAPTGFILAQGQEISRTTYAALFAVMSTTFGIGDGSTTFNLPDLRQRFPIGVAASGTASALGDEGGDIEHTHTGGSHTHTGPSHTHTMPTHTHTGPSHLHTMPTHTHTFADTSGYESGTDIPVPGGTTVFSASADEHTHYVSGTTSATDPGDTALGGTGVTGATDPGNTNAGGTAATGATASGTGGSGNPPFLALNFIVKT
jgi:microcystin-dependent protein